jgi:hypothetical protein
VLIAQSGEELIELGLIFGWEDPEVAAETVAEVIAR